MILLRHASICISMGAGFIKLVGVKKIKGTHGLGIPLFFKCENAWAEQWGKTHRLSIQKTLVGHSPVMREKKALGKKKMKKA